MCSPECPEASLGFPFFPLELTFELLVFIFIGGKGGEGLKWAYSVEKVTNGTVRRLPGT